jgi:hypothetical protein
MSSVGTCEYRGSDDLIERMSPAHWGRNVISGACENRTPDDGIERVSPSALGVAKCHQSLHANTEGPTTELNVCLHSPATLGVKCHQSVHANTEGSTMELNMSPATLGSGGGGETSSSWYT